MRFTDIRSKFVEFYENLGFQLLPRAPLLHPSIPMSFVMSAGLVQVETSLSKVNNRSNNKFVLVQDCFRHFDLEKVGTDDIHLSLFEMPGAFIFSQNGKSEAISNMWELATEKLGIDAERIWVSYFRGGQLGQLRLPEDTVARQTWLALGFPENRLIGLGIDDNYWVQGNGLEIAYGPLRKCGVSTELFFDRGSNISCGKNCKPGCRCGRFIEFSNSLFISQEFHTQENKLIPMEDPFIETVIGTERVIMILESVESVFQTELYRSIINTIRSFTIQKNIPPNIIIDCERVIADYLRALCVLVFDGAPPPGKNGRERIIKLLIRGVLLRKVILGIDSEDFLSALVNSTMKTVGTLQIGSIDQIISKLKVYFDSESEKFYKTIRRGEAKLESILDDSKVNSLSGSQVLSLEKNWGLPHLYTEKVLHENGLKYDIEDYHKALDKWKKLIAKKTN